MGRLLFFVLLISAVYLIVRSLLPATKDAPDKDKLASEQLEPCAHCGTYISNANVVRDRGKTYCSPEHRDADDRNNSDG